VIRFLGVVVFLWAGFNFVATFSNIPVIDEQIRRDSLDGGWTVAVGSDLFDKGQYLFQIGYGYANADDSMAKNTDEDNPMALANERAELAVLYLSESVSVDPGNAHAWAALAWSEAALGNIDGARAAMVTSWKIAPYNMQLAATRPEFVALIDELILEDIEFASASGLDEDVQDELLLPKLTEFELGHARADLGLLASRNRALAEEIAISSPVLENLLPPLSTLE